MNGYSPIRTLDPRDQSLERVRRLKYESLRDNRLEDETLRLRTAVERSIEESRSMQYFSRRSIGQLAIENQGLKGELVYNLANASRIQNNVNKLIVQNQGLKDRLMAEEASKLVEVEHLRRKYMQIQIQGRNDLEQTYTDEIRFLLRELDRLKHLLGEKSVQFEVQFRERMQQKQEYDAGACRYISQINNLKNQILILESQKNQQIRQLNSKTELERSRTVGIIGSSKESTNFMDREIRKLAQDLVDKNTQLEDLTKNLLSQKKKNDQQTKTFNQRVSKLISEQEETLRDRLSQFQKRQASLNEQILDQKRKETELHMKIDQMEKQFQALQHQYQLTQRSLNDQQDETRNLKDVLDRLRDDHLKEITKLMTQKLKRRSSKMLSSQRSIGSSLKDSNIAQSREDIGSPRMTGMLPVVRQEVYMRQSKQSQDLQNKSLLENHEIVDEDQDCNALIAHYETMMEELRKSYDYKQELLSIEMSKLRRELSQKQEEFEDILKRFTPLVKIHAGQKSIEQDRKERIERHWKADISLLEILLDKYKIQAF